MTSRIVLVSSAIIIFATVTTISTATITTTVFAFPFSIPTSPLFSSPPQSLSPSLSPFNQQQFFSNLWGKLCQNSYIAATISDCGFITQHLIPPIITMQPSIVRPSTIPSITQAPMVQAPITQSRPNPNPNPSTTASVTSQTSQCINDFCTICINGKCSTTGVPPINTNSQQSSNTLTCINNVCTTTSCLNGVCTTSTFNRP